MTALVARDPWHAGLPLGGFVRLRDAETGATVRAFVDRAARERFRRAVATREADVLRRLRDAGVRMGVLDADAGARSRARRAFHIA